MLSQGLPSKRLVFNLLNTGTIESLDAVSPQGSKYLSEIVKRWVLMGYAISFPEFSKLIQPELVHWGGCGYVSPSSEIVSDSSPSVGSRPDWYIRWDRSISYHLSNTATSNQENGFQHLGFGDFRNMDLLLLAMKCILNIFCNVSSHFIVMSLIGSEWDCWEGGRINRFSRLWVHRFQSSKFLWFQGSLRRR